MTTHLSIKVYDKLEEYCDLNYSSTITELHDYLYNYDDRLKFFIDTDIDGLLYLLERSYFKFYTHEAIVNFLNGSEHHENYLPNIVKISDKNIYILEIETIK